MKIRSPLTALALAALLTSAAHAAVTVTLIDTGAPKVPTSLSPTGFMDGYTGYIIRVSTSVDRISAFDFGLLSTGAIVGDFSQKWTASNADAIAAGTGYDTPTPGTFPFNNSTVSTGNVDTHFLGTDVLLVGISENAAFSGGANTNPFTTKNNDVTGYGSGTFLAGQIGIIGSAQSATVDIAYVVVPTGSNIAFYNAEVIVNGTKNLISYPAAPVIAAWTGLANGSWATPANWSNGTVPSNAPDIATINTAGTFTLDGNRTLAKLSLAGNSTTIAPGSGGALVFNAFSHPATLAAANAIISVPVVLISGLQINNTLPGASVTFSNVITGGADAPLNIDDGVRVTLTANNTYKGATRLRGQLYIGDGGTSGTLGDGPLIIGSNNPASSTLLEFNRSDTYIVNNDITGNITYLNNRGPGTVVLAGHNSFAVATKQIFNGALIINGNDGFNASNNNILSTGGYAFSVGGPTVSVLLGPKGSFANIGATAADDLRTRNDLRAGVASIPLQVSMRYRTRAPAEVGTLLADVLELSGMHTGATAQSDPFALESSYAPQLISNETDAAAHGQLFLAWSDPLDPSNKWVNAVDGNFGIGTNVFTNVHSSWSTFAASHAITDTNVGLFLGSWGVDTASDTVWAVLNHNSQFAAATAIVPEPASLSVLVLGVPYILKRKKS